jgi:beta-barrel assembly-enhancing protease
MKTMQKRIAALALLGSLALLAAPGQGTGQNLDFGKALKAGGNLVKASKPMNFEEEHALGRQVAARLAGNFGVWNDPDWTLYINLVGRALVPYSERSDIKYRFAILKVDDINAYSAPAGYIFITRGMLKQLDSEAQLAGVLGHEIAHVAKKHIVKEVQKSNIYSAGAIAAATAANVDEKSQEALNKLTDLSWNLLINKGFSKQDEYDADQSGAKNAFRMGYNPLGLREFLVTLETREKENSSNMKTMLSTHPAPAKRLDKLDEFITEKGWKPENRQDNKERFQDFKKRHPIP